MQVPYFPPLQSPAQFTPSVCQQLIEAAAGFSQQQQQQVRVHAPQASQEAGGGPAVHSVKTWVMSAEVAEEYADWGDRLLLAGDAAHRWVWGLWRKTCAGFRLAEGMCKHVPH